MRSFSAETHAVGGVDVRQTVVMEPELRVVTVTEDLLDDTERVVSGSFGAAPATGERLEFGRRIYGALSDPELRLAAVLGDRVIGGAAALDMTLTVAPGSTLRAAGLAGVGVDATMVGRGAMRALLETHLARAAERGYAASLLTASETSLYGRFGYGPATWSAIHEGVTDRLRVKPFDDPGRIDLHQRAADVAEELEVIHDRWAAQTPGATARSAPYWEILTGPDETWMGGGPQFAALHSDADGQLDGYALYKWEPVGDDDGPVDQRLVLNELVGLDLTAELALFRFVTTVPMIRSLRWRLAPVDPRIRWWLEQQRQLRLVERTDRLWLRILDLPAFIGALRPTDDASVVVELADPLAGHLDALDLSGRWRLRSSNGVASAERTDDEPGIRTDVSTFGSLVLGGTAVGRLRAARRLRGDARSVGELERIVHTGQAPFSLTRF